MVAQQRGIRQMDQLEVKEVCSTSGESYSSSDEEYDDGSIKCGCVFYFNFLLGFNPV